MKDRFKNLFRGNRKFLTIPAIPLAAILAVPFVIPGLLGLFIHKKWPASKWKYGLFTLLTLIGLSSAPTYYANLPHSFIASPNPTKNQAIDAEVNAALAPTDTPIPTLLPPEPPTSPHPQQASMSR